MVKRPNLDLGVWVQQSLLRKPYLGQDLSDWSWACLWLWVKEGPVVGQGFVMWMNSSKPTVQTSGQSARGKEEQGDRDMWASHGICPYLGLTVIGNDALAKTISLMKRSNNPMIGSAPWPSGEVRMPSFSALRTDTESSAEASFTFVPVWRALGFCRQSSTFPSG